MPQIFRNLEIILNQGQTSLKSVWTENWGQRMIGGSALWNWPPVETKLPILNKLECLWRVTSQTPDKIAHPVLKFMIFILICDFLGCAILIFLFLIRRLSYKQVHSGNARAVAFPEWRNSQESKGWYFCHVSYKHMLSHVRSRSWCVPGGEGLLILFGEHMYHHYPLGCSGHVMLWYNMPPLPEG